ncbi:DcuS/MalK family sensor histidine kinase [Robertmurraya kyonggiensis]|nr:DcuS/MalK family sensor histidine kinase [Robertmurraya kyonggiensis]
MKWKKMKLKYMIILLVSIVVSFSILVTGYFINSTISARIVASQEEKALNVSRMIAQTPTIIDALKEETSVPTIQNFTRKIQTSTNVEFIVVLDMNGIRKSHPDSSKIGEKFVGGDEKDVLVGKEYSSISEGTLGKLLRAFTPIFDQNHQQIGAVAVGISLERISLVLSMIRKNIFLGIGIGMIFGTICAVLLSYFVKRVLLGLEPSEIARILNERQALIESVHEGIIAVDQDGNITLVNKSAMNLFGKLGLKDNPIGKKVDSYLINSKLKQTLKTGKPYLDQEQLVNGSEVMSNTVPIIVDGEIVGAVNTLRDKSEIKQLAEQLTGVQLYADALRAQSHEFMNQLHCILGMIHLKEYSELEKFIEKTVEDTQNDIRNITKKLNEPALVGFLLGKLSYAREKGIQFELSIQNMFPGFKDPQFSHDLITIIGNLIDNAMDASQKGVHKHIVLLLDFQSSNIIVEMRDFGEGISKEHEPMLFEKGFSTKGEHRGYGLFLVKQSIEKLKGSIKISSSKSEGSIFTVTIPYILEGE